MMKPHHYTAQGQAGVYRVLSELILRGHNPFLPVADDHGVDILIGGGSVRLQVKTTMRPLHLRRRNEYRTYPEGTLMFQLGKHVYGNGNGRPKNVARRFSHECDILILWAIESNRFWIVPAHLLDGRGTLALTPKQQFIEFDFEQAQKWRAAGMTFREIGERLGVNEVTVKRRIYRLPQSHRRQTSVEIRKCEGRWDLIDQYVATAREANEVVRARPEAVVAHEAFLQS